MEFVVHDGNQGRREDLTGLELLPSGILGIQVERQLIMTALSNPQPQRSYDPYP